VVLDIDVQGAAQVRARCPDTLSIFLQAPSLATYEKRLRARGTESEAAILRRLEGARRELEHAGEYDYRVINDDLETAVAEVRAIVLGAAKKGSDPLL
jgi:guanylate kinase